MNIGKKILEMFDYKEKEIIYYKTDLQTHKGTIATGSKKNHMYKLFNHLYDVFNDDNLYSSKIFFSIEEHQIIERYNPIKKQKLSYPSRYDNSVFEKFNEINTNTKLQNDYKKWKDGINYETNRKIEIGGKIHRKLKNRMILG